MLNPDQLKAIRESRGTLKCALLCVELQKRQGTFAANTAIGRVLEDFSCYSKGEFVLVRDSGTTYIVEKPLTPQEVAERGESLITTIATTIGVPKRYVETFPALLDHIAALTAERDEANIACNVVLNSLEWTGDGYSWNPTHGDYREQPFEALNRGVRETVAQLTTLTDENARLKREVEEAKERLCEVANQMLCDPQNSFSDWTMAMLQGVRHPIPLDSYGLYKHSELTTLRAENERLRQGLLGIVHRGCDYAGGICGDCPSCEAADALSGSGKREDDAAPPVSKSMAKRIAIQQEAALNEMATMNQEMGLYDEVGPNPLIKDDTTPATLEENQE